MWAGWAADNLRVLQRDHRIKEAMINSTMNNPVPPRPPVPFGEDEMNVSVDSPNTTYHYGSPWWSNLLMLGIVAAAVVLAVWLLKPGTTPQPTPGPAPANGGHLDVVPGLPEGN